MAGRREMTFPRLPYIIVYQVRRNAAEISRIFHGAQNWPNALSDSSSLPMD
jgi:plasmid stabilization system protein ParE